MSKGKIIIVVIIFFALVGGLFFLSNGEETSVKAENFIFCAKEPTDYQQFIKQPNATYDIGDYVWVYTNITDVTADKQDGEFLIWVQTKALVKKEGEVVKKLRKQGQPVSIQEGNIDKLYSYRGFETDNFSPGNYKIDFIIKDLKGGDSITISKTFTLIENSS